MMFISRNAKCATCQHELVAGDLRLRRNRPCSVLLERTKWSSRGFVVAIAQKLIEGSLRAIESAARAGEVGRGHAVPESRC